jgi:phosphate transport system permease protein
MHLSTQNSSPVQESSDPAMPAREKAAEKVRLARVRLFRIQDFIFARLTQFFALLVLFILAGILVSLTLRSLPILQHVGISFFWRNVWRVPNQEFGALVAIYGTLTTSLIALLIAVPVSFGIALFLTETCPLWLRRPLGTAIELLAGVPSIVYGIWGLFIFAPLFSEHIQPTLHAMTAGIPGLQKLFSGPPIGIGILTAGIILSLMIIPFIASVTRDVFETVPPVLKESAYGLGSTTWEVIRYIVLPYTRVGVIGGVMLGLGRALGETMAVTFVIGNANAITGSLFSPGNSIASTLANQFSEAEPGLHVSALFALGLILFMISFTVLVLSQWLIRRGNVKTGS